MYRRFPHHAATGGRCDRNPYSCTAAHSSVDGHSRDDAYAHTHASTRTNSYAHTRARPSHGGHGEACYGGSDRTWHNNTTQCRGA